MQLHNARGMENIYKKINLIGHNKMCAAVLKMSAIATYLEAVQSNHKSRPHLI
jgi:hypothetical protein